MAPQMSLYGILQLERHASGEEVRRAYQRLARAHHPDQGGDGASMARINQAYRVLSDSHLRTEYDLSLRPLSQRRRVRAWPRMVRAPRFWMLLLAVFATSAGTGWALVRKPWAPSGDLPPASPASSVLPAGDATEDPLRLVPARQLGSVAPRRRRPAAPQAPLEAVPTRAPATADVASAR